MSPHVYLLAAGRGKRAGGPKAWRDCGGQTLLEAQLGFLRQRFSRVVVTVQSDWLERCAGLAAGAVWVPVDPDASPLASLQAALRAEPMTRWCFLYHVDMRVWEPGLFALLELAAAKTRAEALIPTFGGRKGHPVMLSPALQAALLALDPARDRLDSFLRTRRVETPETDFVCVLDNWNSSVHPNGSVTPSEGASVAPRQRARRLGTGTETT